MQVTMGRRAVTAFILAGLCLVAVVVLNHQRASTSSLLDESRWEDGPETRAEKQSLALAAVGRILQHHAPANNVHKHPDYWPGVSFFAKRREQAWKEQKEAQKLNAVQQELREGPPRGPSGQKLTAGQAAIAAKFNELSGGSSKAYSTFQREYEKETGHASGPEIKEATSSHQRSAERASGWGSTWNVPHAHKRGQARPMLAHERERPVFRQSLEGPGESESKEATLEAEVDDLKKQLGEMKGEVAEVRHGWERGMHVEGGSTRVGAVWDGDSRRAVRLQENGGEEDAGEDGEETAEGGGVAMGAEGEKDYDKYGVELDKWKDPTPLHYRDDIAGGVEVHTREDEIRKIQEYQNKIAAEQGKMREEWKKLMEEPPEVTDATRPDIMDPDSFPTEGSAFRKKYQEMKDFKAAVEAFNHDPEFNPMIVLKAHHLVKYGIPAPETDSIDVWRQWYRETLDKYKVVRHEVTDMASGNWHDYDTDWEIHGLHRPGAYKKVWRTRDNWGPGKPHTPLVESPNANYTLTAGGGVAEEAEGGELRNETAGEVAEAEAEAEGSGGEGEEAAEENAEADSGADVEAAEGGAEAGAAEESREEGSVQEKSNVAALASKVDKLENKLDSVVNLLEASHGSSRGATALHAQEALHDGRLRQRPLRKAVLPSAAERDRLSKMQEPKRGMGLVAVTERPSGGLPKELQATAAAAAVSALTSAAGRASASEEKILNSPPKAVVDWLASALEAAGKGGASEQVHAPSTTAMQSLVASVRPGTAGLAVPLKTQTPASPAVAAPRAQQQVPADVQEMIRQGTWESGQRSAVVGSTQATAPHKHGPPLYSAADALKDAQARATANKAIKMAEAVKDSPDAVVHAKTASHGVMQTGPDPSLAAKANSDPLKRVAKAILVEHGSLQAQAAQADGDVDPEGKTYRAPVPKSLTKKFVGGREMYVPKYDHKKAGGDGWGWLW